MNDNVRSISELAEEIAGRSLPILILDTCVFLDIIRAPFRHHNAVETIAGAMRLIEREKEYVLVVASIVPDEFHENHPRVASELAKHCLSIINGMTTFNGLLETLGFATYPSIPPDTWRTLESRLGNLAQQLLTSAFTLIPNDDIALRAFNRSTNRVPPGHRGGQEKDCLIYEEFLELSFRVREKNHRERIVYCTSNTKDYCEFRSNAFPEIARELDAVNVAFTTSLNWAYADLELE